MEVFVAIVKDRRVDDEIRVFLDRNRAVDWAVEGIDRATRGAGRLMVQPCWPVVWGCTDGYGDCSARVECCELDAEFANDGR